LSLEDLQKFLISSRGVVEWAAAMVKAVYGDEVNKYSSFEPKAYQFLDDRIRSSVVLDLGESVSILGNTISTHSSIENDVLGISQESAIRGLNPGYAFGELVVADEAVESIEFSKNKIYVFERPPSGLKPVAGIMTVSEGNLVSHVQLLARNLGVPNAALSNENLKSLKKYNGQKVFYAVSNKGNVIIKLEKDMTSSEKGLFSKEQQNSNKIKVPVDRIKLDQTNIINLRDVNADDSGKICGPKAANLGQLKSIFPDHVVEGFVIPFGIFRMHLDNPMPGQQMTYWQYLNNIYTEANEMKANNKSADEIDAFQLERLNYLKNAIQDMELNADFLTQLETEFNKALGSPMGTVPVFLRSDTNMEDLKDFTGAGLNLTLFNVRSKENILNGIKEVWASPYMERSVRWRQKYLLNPEYVFPSIVVIPGVNVDYSGVVISTGINVGEKDDMTVAFSRGAGGAVDGQAAETRWITAETDYLLSPSREPTFVSLPAKGGTKENYTSFERPILNKKNVQSIRDLVKEVRIKMPERTDPNYKGAYDMEMGFK
ncbi:PEP/pyruvate-binding domain-containing protein, partial [Robiginitalea sp.]|uniref:PEP/pyruvate-binding domain-containing protein n=1 Tax=Robiginitalea sp. TaxID=1902411 RepID=UPI003C74B36A